MDKFVEAIEQFVPTEDRAVLQFRSWSVWSRWKWDPFKQQI